MHSPVQLGTSREGRPIRLFTFPKRNGNIHEVGTLPFVETLFIGAFHGDEGFSTEILNRFQQWIETTSMFPFSPEKVIGILPALNPDGLVSNQRTNAAGVDLNRNWPTKNWDCSGRETPYYGGEMAGSEPETQVLLQLLQQVRPKKIVSLHTPYRVLNYDGPHGEEMANAMAGWNHYPVVGSIGYPTPGSFGTYAGIEHHIPTITLELPEDEPLEKIWEDNRWALVEAIRFPIP